jgi:hypothetical protein
MAGIVGSGSKGISKLLIGLLIEVVIGGGAYGAVGYQRRHDSDEASKSAAALKTAGTAKVQNDTTQTAAPGSKLSPAADTKKSTSEAPAPAVAANGMALGLLSGSVVPGQNFTVRVYENSGSAGVNAAQIKLSFDPTQLTFSGLTQTGKFDVAAATDTSAAGTVRAARGSTQGPLTGQQPVADVSFQVKAGASGTAALQLDSKESYIVRSSDATNILQTTTGVSLPISKK